jgi:Icc-related predicted phosphoesterase
MNEKKILVLSDMHGDRTAVAKAKDFAKREGAHIIVYLGDFSEKLRDVHANVADAEYLIKELKGVAKVHALFGNCDVSEVRALLEHHDVALHNKIIMLGDTAMAGWGGSHPTPFNTPSEFAEEVIERELDRLLEDAAKRGAKRVILFTHEPPARTNADKIPVGHVGSESLRRMIEKHKPELHVSGHIHEAKSVDQVGETKVINVGQAKHGNFLEVVVGDRITTREISL